MSLMFGVYCEQKSQRLLETLGVKRQDDSLCPFFHEILKPSTMRKLHELEYHYEWEFQIKLVMCCYVKCLFSSL